MRINLNLALLVTLITAWSTGQVLACDRTDLEGTWSRSVSEENIPAGATIIWAFQGDEMNSTIQLTDSLTGSGSYGPYFESETNFRMSFDEKNCAFFGTATATIERSFRTYGEPTADVSVATVQKDIKIQYRVTLSKDKSLATFDDGQNPAFTLIRK